MVVAMGLSGTIGLFVVTSGQPALTVVFFRCLIGGLALLSWLLLRGSWRPLSRRDTGWLLLGAMALILNWICLFSSYRLSSISVATVVYHVQPFFLLLLVALSQKELPSRSRLPWLALAFVGVAMTAGIDLRDARQAGMLYGVLLALAAAFLYALATLATRKLPNVPPAQIAGIQLVTGVVALAPLVDFRGNLGAVHTWSSLLVLGLVHTGLMYNLMYAAFQRLPAAMVASLSFIYPVVAILVDLAFFHVALSSVQVLGILLILLAVVANQRAWDMSTLGSVVFAQLRSHK